MKKMKKVLVLTVACALCTAFGALSVNNTSRANANEKPAIQTHGASVRMIEPTGFRFLSSVSASYAEGYEIGTLVISKNDLGENTLNHNDDATDEIDVEYTEIVKTEWSNNALAEMEGFDYDETRFYFNAVLPDITEIDCDTVVVARSYAVKDGVYTYGEPIERSIAQVAAYAMQDGETGELLENYIDTALGETTLTMANDIYVAQGKTALNINGTNDYAVTWSSSDEEVATVSKNGVLTAKSNGKTIVDGKLGTQMVSTTVQVGDLLEGEKLVDFTANNYTQKAKPANGTSAYNENHLYDGEGTIALTCSSNWQANLEIKGIDISEVTTLKVMVYQNTSGNRVLRAIIKDANGEYKVQLGATKEISRQWTEFSFSVSSIRSSHLDVKLYFGTSASGNGEKGDIVYISDVYGSGVRADIPVGDKLVNMSTDIENGKFKNDGVNASVSYSEEYTKFGSGMAKITATSNWQSAGVYTESLDVSAYSKITFSVYRPAGEGGYYLRVKSKFGENDYRQIYSETSIDKKAGEWINVTINVADLKNENLQNFYVQFGTKDSTQPNTQAEGVKDKYIYVSDIYGELDFTEEELKGYTPTSLTMSLYDTENSVYGFTYNTRIEPIKPVIQIQKGNVLTNDCEEYEVSVESASSYDDNSAPMGYYIAKAEIALEKNTTYSYRAYDKAVGVGTEVVTFTTKDTTATAFKFAHVGDSQGSGAKFGNVLNNLSDEMDFLVHTGDVVENSKLESQWTDMLNGNFEYLSKLPVMAISGNHETTYKNGSNETYKHFNNNIPTQESTLKGYFYSFVYGNVKFIMLNTNDLTDSKLKDEQYNWLVNELENNECTWTIVAMHNPMYSVGKYGSDPERNTICLSLREQLQGLFAEYGVDIVLQGHDHAISRTKALDGQGNAQEETLETINGIEYSVDPSGVIYVMNGPAGEQSREPFEGADTSLYEYAEGSNACSWAEITIDGDMLLIEVKYYQDAKVKTYYSWGIKKTA